MKKLGKLKLNQLSKNELDRRKLNALKGGCATACQIDGCSGATPPPGYDLHANLESSLERNGGY